MSRHYSDGVEAEEKRDEKIEKKLKEIEEEKNNNSVPSYFGWAINQTIFDINCNYSNC